MGRRHGPRATQKPTSILQQTVVPEVVCRALVPTAVYTLLRSHADDPRASAAHMQRTAITKTATQLAYGNHRYLHTHSKPTLN